VIPRILRYGLLKIFSDQPFKSFISGLLDITIIKPIIECGLGYDLITGEDLTSFELTMKSVFVVVDIVTLGSAIVATKGIEIGGTTALKLVGKTVAVTMASDATAYTVGYISNQAGAPLALTMLLSLGSGIVVSKVAGKYIFKSASGKLLGEAEIPDESVDGLKGILNSFDDVTRIKEVEVDFTYNLKYDEKEFAKQLADQEKGMNKLTVAEYLKNREKYIAEGRAIEGNAAQQAARKEALANKVDELLDSGMSFQQAEKQAQKWLDSQAALHNPDQIAGGNPLNIGGMGDKVINSSIGSQWKYRIDAVDEQIQAMAKDMTDAERKNTYLNVKLKY